ncbi:hypothetical protein LBMAG21_10850 [Armatimonadota bacterium]|nr:hypothetical protein LBMAG21_10850 [Armatimonadota bacterium]
MCETEQALTARVAEFKEQGFTVFKKMYLEEQMQLWREKHLDLQERGVRSNLGHAAWWFKDMTEHAPHLMLPAVANQLILDFAERVMGPFIQLDNLTLAGFPSISPEEAAGKASGWHRDRWAQVPRSEVFERPHAINAICYLQDLTDAYGPLRVIPASHRRPLTLAPDERGIPHPEEQIIHMEAGDVVVIHNALLHSGTPNTSGKTRYFFSIFYNLTWLRHTDNHAGPNVLQIIENARQRNDHRTMRLFGVDEHLEVRANSGFQEPDEMVWAKWAEADRVAIKQG